MVLEALGGGRSNDHHPRQLLKALSRHDQRQLPGVVLVAAAGVASVLAGAGA